MKQGFPLRAASEVAEASANWDLENVVAGLRQKPTPDGRAAVQVFLDIGTDDVATAARRLVSQAYSASGADRVAEIGKVHGLARSFGVRATPDLVAALGRQPGVRAILPAEIDDIHPAPVNVHPR